ncbi:glycerophosphodiester phosphodiesterase [Nocardiopsis sp. HNM0947]|uniref:Glycerophosphodiester phosphodiesterase n=1 Tax=Nocardiopsis coralli TaxID=2772213 RepID=A0ABR9P246_9ACTN|nr:glycerophosphodiester phosphodiesterase family protein [Nocardiopsis coralli]MBE2997899.1 glycerophosphodiester phosphodiesterase [Nocardiopsis coralli]
MVKLPFRVATLTAALTFPLAALHAPTHADTGPDEDRDFDLQAHRGGMGLVVESTLPAFENALQLGVSTLELDIQITRDGEAVVTHDRQVGDHNCQDTGPAFPGDPQYPYVGSYIKDLDLEQVRTLDCGSLQHPDFPEQQVVPGEPMALLSEAFDLVHRYGAHDVALNIETKVEAGAPEETAPREEFVDVLLEEIDRAHILPQVTVQSFDWGSLMLVREREPRLPIVALDNHEFLEIGEPGASPWLGGIDIDDFDGDPVLAVDSFGADAFSPVHGFPQDGEVGDPDYEPYVTEDMVDRAHDLGIGVIPWTVDDTVTMQSLIDTGIDGLITDRPDRLREVMADNGFRLPERYPEPGTG